MVVAFAASHRQPQPDRKRRIDAVDNVLDLVLFGNDSPFGVAAMIAVEGGCDQMIQTDRIANQVASPG